MPNRKLDGKTKGTISQKKMNVNAAARTFVQWKEM